jgi:hypothetical protein
MIGPESIREISSNLDLSSPPGRGQGEAGSLRRHQNGIFAGTNDLVEKLAGRPPMTLDAFIEKHRAAFE